MSDEPTRDEAEAEIEVTGAAGKGAESEGAEGKATAGKATAKKAPAKKPAAKKEPEEAKEPARPAAKKAPVKKAPAKKVEAKKPAAKKEAEAEAKAEAKAQAKGSEEPAETTKAEPPKTAEAKTAAEAKTTAEAKKAAEAKKPARKEAAKAPPRRRVVRAHARYVRTSSRKARMVSSHLPGKSVAEARAILEFTPREVAQVWSKLLESAIANAEHNHELLEDDLVVRDAYANEGPTIKRFRPRAMGRATPINKRTSHLTITLTTGARGA